MIVDSVDLVLRRALDQKLDGSEKLGGRTVDKILDGLSTGAAQARLWLNVSGILMVLLFILMITLVIVFRGSGAFTLAAITSFSGVTLAGGVRMLVDIAKTLNDFEILKDLLRDLPPTERTKLAKILIEARSSISSAK